MLTRILLVGSQPQYICFPIKNSKSYYKLHSSLPPDSKGRWALFGSPKSPRKSQTLSLYYQKRHGYLLPHSSPFLSVTDLVVMVILPFTYTWLWLAVRPAELASGEVRRRARRISPPATFTTCTTTRVTTNFHKDMVGSLEKCGDWMTIAGQAEKA